MTAREEPPGRSTTAHLAALNVGLSSFSEPLGATARKKYECLARLASLTVVGFSTTGRRVLFVECARFDLVPRSGWPLVRFVRVVLHALRVGRRAAVGGSLHVVVSEDPFVGIAGLLLRHLAGRAGRRVIAVTEVHGDWMSLFHYVRVPRWLRPFPARWAAFVLGRSDLIRTASHFLEQRVLETLGGPVPPITVFPTYTDFERFLQDEDPGSRPSGREETVLFVGALAPVKGLDVLLDAFVHVHRRRPHARLRMAGEGPLRTTISDRIVALGLEGVASLAGWLAPDELHRSLAAARVLVLPSLSEGLGRVVLEALACGVPIVASRVGGIPELVREGETGFLVPPGESKPLADRIVWLLEHPDRAAAMGRAGRAWVRETFSTERYVAGYRAVFDAARALGSP